MFSFALYPYVYLLARTAFLEQSRERARSRPARRPRRLGQLLARRAAARPAGDRRRHGARADGDAGGLRHRLVLRAWRRSPPASSRPGCRWATGRRRRSSRPACSASCVLVLALERASRGARALSRRRAAQAAAAAAPARAPRRRSPSPPARRRWCSASCCRPDCCCTWRWSDWADAARRRAPARRWSRNSFTLAGHRGRAGGGARRCSWPMPRASRAGRSSPRANRAAVARLRDSRRGDRGRHPGAARPARQLRLRTGCEAAFGVDAGLLLTGTIVALVYAYLVRFLAVALQTVEAGLAKVTPSMDDAARSLGAAPARDARARARAAARAPASLTAALLRVRRRDEGAAGDLRAAAVQLRHAGGRGLQPRQGRAAGRSRDARRW